MRYGTIRPQGDVVDTWQLVEDKSISYQGTDDVNDSGSANTTEAAFSQGFKVDTTEAITKIKVSLALNVGTETGTLTAYIYSDDGTGKPNSSLSTFSNKDVSTFTTSPTFTEYTFTGSYTPTAATQYHIVFIWTSPAGGAIRFEYNNSSDVYADGVCNRSSDGGTTWANYGYDMYFYVIQALTTYTFSGLDGDTDEVYKMVISWKNGASSTAIVGMRLNASSSSYGDQYFEGSNVTLTASRDTANRIYLTYVDIAAGRSAFYRALIYAKSGYARTVMVETDDNITGTTVTTTMANGGVWNNTVDNITSIQIWSNSTSGLGMGTQLLLYKKVV